MTKQQEHERWSSYFSGDENLTLYETEAEAAGEMQFQIDSDYEPGEEIEYCIAPMLSAKQILLKRNALAIGEHIFESLNEDLSDDMHAEETPLDMTKEDKEQLGRLVSEFICQHAKNQWWTVDDKREQKCTYVAGANDAAKALLNAGHQR